MQITCVECGGATRRRTAIRKAALLIVTVAAAGIAYAVATYKVPYKTPDQAPPQTRYKASDKAPSQTAYKAPRKAPDQAPSKTPDKAPFDYGDRAADVRKYKATLDKEPCDRIAIIRLADALVGDFYHLGRLRSLEEISAAIDDVTVADVMEYVRKYPAENLTILTIGPDELKAPGRI